MKTIKINYESTREEFENAAAEVLSAGKATIVTADKNVDGSIFKVTIELKNSEWHAIDNDPLHGDADVEKFNKRANICDAEVNIKDLLQDICEDAESDDDIVVNIEEENNEEQVKDLERDILNERNYTFGFVATFNADPYCVETEEEMEEIKDSVREYGVEEVKGELEREDALAKLDAENYEGPVYRSGELLFITNK